MATHPAHPPRGSLSHRQTAREKKKHNTASNTTRAITNKVNNGHTASSSSTLASTTDASPPTATSRLCVKNLPVHLTSPQLLTHFSSLSTTVITDCAVMHTPDGRSRKFGFIGYQSSEMATAALKYFNNSYIGTSRINVSYALERGSTQLARPWSQYSTDSSRYQQKHGITEAHHTHTSTTTSTSTHKQPQQEERKEEEEPVLPHSKQSKGDKVSALLATVLPAHKASKLSSDPVFHDYLHVMADKGGQRKFWSNDDRLNQQQDNHHKNKDSTKTQPAADSTAREEEAERLRLLQQLKEDDSDDEDNHAAAYDAHNDDSATTSAATVSMTDLEYLKAKQAAFQDDNDADQAATTTAGEEQVRELDMCRLFVRNIGYQWTEEDLQTHFSPYGAILSIHLPMHTTTATTTQQSHPQNKGFAFVTYYEAEAAQKAVQALHDKILMGRIISVCISQRRPDATTTATNVGQVKGMTYKKQKDVQRQAQANQTHNWNTLFIAPDTVMSSMADQLQIEKSQLINSDESGLAVRLALAETHLITQTKEWLAQEGIDVSVLEKARDDGDTTHSNVRSKRVIIVKNLPYDTDVMEIRQLFAKYGAVLRVLCPPSKTVVLVEYADDVNAKKGFMGLAYKKYHHAPLYLEWAPMGLLKPVSTHTPSTTDTTTVSTDSLLQTTGTDAADDENLTSTIFVKNLNFNTTESTLRTLISRIAPVRSVTIAKKKSSSSTSHKTTTVTGEKKPTMLSMGYGFVELHSVEDVQKVITAMNGKEVEGHILVLQPSSRVPIRTTTTTATTTSLSTTATPSTITDTSTVNAEHAPSSRLIVKNLAFETSSSELRRLLSHFGVVQRVRLPKKFDGSHRGFAFVDFASKQEAWNVMQKVKDTHLYGRRLLLQWSEAGEEEEQEEQEEEGRAGEAAAGAAAQEPKSEKKKNVWEAEKRVAAKREKVRRQYESSLQDLPQHKKQKKARVLGSDENEI